MTWKPFHFLVVAIAGWMNRQQQEVIDYLCEENRILWENLGSRIELATRTAWWAAFLAATATAAVAAAPPTAPTTAAVAPVAPIAGGYAVVVSRGTQGDAAWAKLTAALASRHGGQVIVYDGAVTQCLPPLRAAMPRYACFVARPEEAGRQFVLDVHRLTRKLDDDPYTDVLWGIVTGYSAEDALRIATAPSPLIIRTGGGGCGLDLALFDSGKWFSEGSAGEYWQKAAGGKPEKKQGPVDSTAAIVDFLNTGGCELFVTSGHATDRDWQIGYSYRNGQFRCRDGKLVGLDTAGKALPIRSANLKVYLAAGNCLMGLIRDRQSMMLAWLGSGGADQAVGYTVSTWYGAMGWGTKDYLLDLPGRYCLSEAFFLANQWIVYQLHKRFPQGADAEFDSFDLETDQALLGRNAAKLGYRKQDENMKDHLGLLWDRDTVALYGDPAWEARLAPRELPLTTELTERAGAFTYAVRVKATCKPNKPLATCLPYRLRDIEITSGKELEPLVTDNFIMLMFPGSYEPGKKYEVVFRAKRGR
jgi:zinc protease